ncbi:hypothetical protein [Gracilibacillus kekensis]|nr:hypothetical protein [Gracilibacillus kekensis]
MSDKQIYRPEEKEKSFASPDKPIYQPKHKEKSSTLSDKTTKYN